MEQELRVKKTEKAKFFKGAKKPSTTLLPVVEEKEEAPVQMNGKHTVEKEEEEETEKVPSSAKKRKKGEKKAKSKATIDTESEESGSEHEPSSKLEETKPANALQNIPNDFRFDPKNLANKPKGLVDALSSFFTPGLKRTSRTAMNSLLKPETVPKESPLAASTPSSVPKSEDQKKVRLSVEEKEGVSKKDEEAKNEERKRHASAGQQQVKSLYDGLSHLYSDCDSRLRSAPHSEKTSEKEKEDEEEEEEEEEKEEDGKENKDESSPNQHSDGEPKEKEDTKKEDKDKTEDGEIKKGSSKSMLLETCMDAWAHFTPSYTIFYFAPYNLP